MINISGDILVINSKNLVLGDEQQELDDFLVFKQECEPVKMLYGQ